MRLMARCFLSIISSYKRAVWLPLFSGSKLNDNKRVENPLGWPQITITGAFEPAVWQIEYPLLKSDRTMAGKESRKADGNDDKNLGKYLELAILLPISTMVGYGIGFGLDKLFGTHFLSIVFMVLGTAGGIIQLIRELS